jgi:hypothetical protein
MPRPASDTRQSLIAALARNRGELDPVRLAAVLRELAAQAAQDSRPRAA